MDDCQLYARVLGLVAPWDVESVDLKESDGCIEVGVVYDDDGTWACPECAGPATRHDTRRRSWRHLDTCQFRTILTAEVPRVRCAEHGVLQLRVPWAEPGSRFTALFEGLTIAWLKEASISAVARLMKMSWDQADGIMERAVRRGLARREPKTLTRIGVDEVSAKRGHRFLTIVSDHVEGTVEHVAFGRKKSALDSFYAGLTPAQRKAIRVVSMDMWQAFISSTKEWIPGADTKIAFDKFHVAQYLGKAVDNVRRTENRELLADGDRTLVKSRYLWLRNIDTMKESARDALDALRAKALKVARAWMHKELAMELWWKRPRENIEADWRAWCRSAAASRLQPIIKVQRTIRTHLQGIVNAIAHQATNARAESINGRIQRVKSMARGFRNAERFRNAIYFHLGGLDLSPAL
jgi:transposase